MNVLFKMNMTAVNHQAMSELKKSIFPMSVTSRTSGCRRQNSLRKISTLPNRQERERSYQVIREVYNTKPA